VAAFDATIGPGGDDDVVAESAISIGAFFGDFHSISQERQRDLTLLCVSGNVSGNVAFDLSRADSVSRVRKIAAIGWVRAADHHIDRKFDLEFVWAQSE